MSEHSDARSYGVGHGSTRWARLRHEWHARLDPSEQSAVISWGAFTTTFVAVRALTHWIRAGHGPKGGGMSLGGRHFHHYNIGIALLTAVGAVAIRGSEKNRRHPAVALAYGSGGALIVDELALLLDLEDVYWAKQGRTSVDAAVGVIAAGATFFAGLPFWPAAMRLRRSGAVVECGPSTTCLLYTS
ncbi:hypothetical protein, partial [Rhodococcus sp. NPDC127528]|uniref:hypothetical protein n=1 Tax=Rhodococcus sp. NPDC127528 TaxID=3345395 RepID=UPI003626103F